MGQPRPKARAKRTADGPCAEDGPPPRFRSWQAPPDGLFDVIVPTLTAKQFVVVQLVCKDWSLAARYCLKNATPKRPDVDLSKLATLYPNLTKLNLSHVEGLSTRMLAPLRQLTALQVLYLSNVALKQQHDATNAATGEAAIAKAGGAGPATAGATGRAGPAAAGAARATSHPRGAHPRAHLNLRSRPRAGTSRPREAPSERAGHNTRTAARTPITRQQPHYMAGPSSTRTMGSAGDGNGEATGGLPSVCDSPLALQPMKLQNVAECGAAGALPGATCGRDASDAEFASVGRHVTGSGAGGATADAQVSPGLSVLLSPASQIFGGLGEVLLRLSKLQADLCPALTTDAIACLPNLTDLTLDTLIAPEVLAPLGRLRCLAVKKLANAEALERLSGLTALLVNSDSSCASEFLPVCTRLPELQSLTFKTSSTKVMQQPDMLCWQGFSRLSSMDLRAPVECLKPGLPALAELAALRNLSLDLYCASDEELMVTVVAPPNLESLSVSSDRSRSGGVVDVHPNPRLRALRIRLYWTALNLVLPEGVPEPSPMPEPLSEDLDSEPRRICSPHLDLRSPPGNGAAHADATVGLQPLDGATAAAGGTFAIRTAAVATAAEREGNFDVLQMRRGTAHGNHMKWTAAIDNQEPCRLAAATAAADGSGRCCSRGLRRRRGTDGSPSPVAGGDDARQAAVKGVVAATGDRRGGGGGTGVMPAPERGLRRRIVRSGGARGGAAAAAAVVVEPTCGGCGGGRGTAVGMVAGGSSEDESGGAGGSDGVSSGEEVGFRGAGPSGTAGGPAAATTATAAAEVPPGVQVEEAAALGPTIHTENSHEAVNVDTEEKAYGDSSWRPGALAMMRVGDSGAAAAIAAAAAADTTLGSHDPHSSRGQLTPHSSLQGAGGTAPAVATAACFGGNGGPLIEGTPRVSCRFRSGGSTCRGSIGGAGVTIATPTGSAAANTGGNPSSAPPPEMQLQELCLDACFFLLYGSLVPLLRQFPHLRKLILENCLALENGELAQLCELSGLRELSLSGLHLVTDTGLRALGRLPSLRSLRVKGLRKLSVHAAQAYLRQKPIVRRYEEVSGNFLMSLSGLSDLRSLALKHLHKAGEAALAAGLGALTQITRLEVKDVHSMSDKVLLALTGHQALQDLSVLHCEGVTSRGRNAVVRSLGHRVALDFEGCSVPDITRPCALPTTSTQAQLIDDDQPIFSDRPRRSSQHSNQH